MSGGSESGRTLCATPGHEAEPAVAMCLTCGAWVCAACRVVAADAVARCPEHVEDGPAPAVEDAPPPAVEDAPPSAPSESAEAPESRQSPEAERDAGLHTRLTGLEPLPWEMPERYGPVAGLWQSFLVMLRNPVAYVTRIPWVRSDLRTPLVFGVTCAIIGQVALVLWMLALGELDRHLGPLFEPLGVDARTGVALSMTLVPLLVTLRLLFFAWTAHLLLRLFSLVRRPFESTLRVYCYAAVAQLFHVVPGAGPFIAMGFAGILTMTGLRLAHGVTSVQAMLGMIPYLLGILTGLGL